MATKQEVLQAHLKKWLAYRGSREQRGALTVQLSEALKMHKKSIGRSMGRLQLTSGTKVEKRGRPKTYGADVNVALAQVWEVMDRPCAENMTRESVDELPQVALRTRLRAITSTTWPDAFPRRFTFVHKRRARAA